MIVHLTGGLGNQMFQYAFGRSLSYVREEELFFTRHLTDNDPEGLRCYNLNVFNIPIQFVEHGAVDGSFSAEKYFGTNTYLEHYFAFNPEVYACPLGTTYMGCWQTERYFEEPLVRSLFFQNGEIMSEQSQLVAEEIKACGNYSVFMHVRRGEYLLTQFHRYEDLTPEAYYIPALDFIRKRVGDVKVFIFSDDPAWCRTKFPQFRIVDHNKPGGLFYGLTTPGTEHEDIWLMSLCKHGIIANSTFSWWGAWLGHTNPTGIIVAPKKWFNDDFLLKNEKYDAKDIVPKRWVTL
jgi:hypothetical protein